MEHDDLTQSQSMIMYDQLKFIESMPDLKDIENRLSSFLRRYRQRIVDAREAREAQELRKMQEAWEAQEAREAQKAREAQRVQEARKARKAREALDKPDSVRNAALNMADILELDWSELLEYLQRKPGEPVPQRKRNKSNLSNSTAGAKPSIANLNNLPKIRKLVTGPVSGPNLDIMSRWSGSVSKQIVELSVRDKKRINKRAARVHDKIKSSTGMNHLSSNVRMQLLPLRDGLPVTRIETENEADEIAARLHAEIPWMAPATEAVWQGLRASAREGLPGIRFEPLILVGSPGIGKSHWVRRLAHHLSIPTTFIDATGEPGSFSLVGIQKGWSSASPGKLVNTMLRERHGGPLVVIDEIEKAGDVRSSKGTSHTLTEALLPMLERMTAKKWECPFFQISFDMSWTNWVMTANSRDGLPDFLQSRCVILELPDLTTEQLHTFAITEGRERGLSEPALESLNDVFDSELMKNKKLDLRSVNRMLDLAGHLEQGPMLN